MFSLIIMLSLLGITLGEDWDYENQDKWPGQCQDGVNQSPISILTSDVIKHKLAPIEYVGYDKSSSFTMKNNGHTVQLLPKAKRAAKMLSPYLEEEYVLAEFHFHWSSEHVIDNHRFALEAHFVHYNSSYENFYKALENEKAVAVVAVLYELSEEDNKSFYKIIKGLPEVEEYSATHQIDDFKIASLAPADHKDYYCYQGSLTTPDCNEGVIWFIMKNPSTISKQQVDQFAKIKDERGKLLRSNYRKLQDLGDRRVFGTE